MIRSNELRIGNYVYDVYDHINRQIDRHDFINTKQHFNPVPLTEEWLIRFGFRNRKSNTSISYSLKVNERNVDVYIKNGEWRIGSKIILMMPYVHTLQNFFALVGEELTIKE